MKNPIAAGCETASLLLLLASSVSPSDWRLPMIKPTPFLCDVETSSSPSVSSSSCTPPQATSSSKCSWSSPMLLAPSLTWSSHQCASPVLRCLCLCLRFLAVAAARSFDKPPVSATLGRLPRESRPSQTSRPFFEFSLFFASVVPGGVSCSKRARMGGAVSTQITLHCQHAA